MKFIKFLLKASGIIILILIVMNSSNIYHNAIMIFSKVPKKFENYSYTRQLDSLLLNSNLNVKIFESHDKESFVILNDSINYLGVNKLDSTTTWYKISTNGSILDSLDFYDDEYIEDVAAYLVHPKKEYYLTWLHDGDTIKKPIQTLNNGAVIKNADTIKKYFTNVEYARIAYVNKPDTNDRIKEVVFYKDDTFYKCYATKEARVNSQSFYHIDDLIEYSNFGNVVFYERKTWNADLAPNFGLAIHGSTPNHWDGYAYIDLNFFGETFKIKDYREASKNYDLTKMDGFKVYHSPNGKYYIVSIPSYAKHTDYLITK